MAIDVDLLARISEDRALASVLLFKHRHPQEEAALHIDIMDAMNSADPLVEIEAFREAAKTTKAEENMILAGCFGTRRYSLLVGEIYDKAVKRLAAIDYECRTNESLHHVFGGPVLARRSTENMIWFKGGPVIQALGWDQEFQSFKNLSDRPDFAFFDDVENLERVRDAAAVDESMQKLYLDIMPAMDQMRFKLVNAQTRRAEDCMVTRLANDPEWVYLGFPICDGDPDDPETKSNWPQRYSMEWIRNKKRTYQRSGMLSYFLQAYMLQAVNPEAKPFKEEMLVERDISPYQWTPKYAIYDPSRTTHQRKSKEHDKSDETGKVVVSKMGSEIHVHESGGYYWKPNAFINDVFATQEKHLPAKICIEKNSLDDWLLQPIRLEMLRRGKPVPLKALQAPQDRNKDEFIMGLTQFAEAHDIVLIGGKGAHPQLVQEWLNFPSGPRNIMNALAYATMVFSGVPMYEDFSGANIQEAPNQKLGEEVFLAFNASPSEAVAVAVLRDGRRLSVAADWSASGALSDAIKTMVFEIRTQYRGATFQSWVPADTYDQWQRIALVPSLQREKLTPMRGEHSAVARGCLSERIRTKWHGAQLLTVDRKARLTLNALSAGYALPVEKGGRQAQEPEPGISRLVGEAIECMVAVLDRQGETDAEGLQPGANVDYTPSGKRFITAHPRRIA
jgi:hypothetical protein